MRKINKIAWERYIKSEEGKQAVALFEKFFSDDANPEFYLEVAKKYDPKYFNNLGKKEIDTWLGTAAEFEDILVEMLNNDIPTKTSEDMQQLYVSMLVSLYSEEIESLDDIPESYFKFMLNLNMPMSMALYSYLPQLFLPNLFVMQFTYLRRFIEKYEIELPEVPKRSDYFGRCTYYLDMCFALSVFAAENELTQQELCAFIFDYELPMIKYEAETEYNKPMPNTPEQAWLLVGNYGKEEKNMDYGFWQANQLTSKGDILLFYEKYPEKKLNSVWIAQEDGVVDPFFNYYSNTYIGNKISIPAECAITFEEFKQSEYFKVENRGRKGNFVSKNFQDCSGWAVTSDDYKEIKRMLSEKGFDVSVLPSLPEYEPIVGTNIKLEADVSDQMLIPLLNRMGWEEGKDFSGEVEFPAGRGETGYAHNKRADFCLHMSEYQGRPRTKVLIEVKLKMKDVTEINKAFDQGVSYAGWAHAEVLVLCDMNQIRVYEKNSKGEFDKNHYEKFKWNEMGGLERLNELKRFLK